MSDTNAPRSDADNEYLRKRLQSLKKVVRTDITEILDGFMFRIHGTPFTGFELLQSILYSSYSLWDAIDGYNPMGANGVLFTVNPKEKFCICTLLKYKKGNPKSKANMNTCSIFPETGSFVFALSKGFIVDNFKFVEPLDDEMDAIFAHQETGDLLIEYKDFCNMLKRDPDFPTLPERRDYKFTF